MIEGWAKYRFEEIVNYTKRPRGLAIPKSIPFVPMELIPLDRFTFEDCKYIDELSSGTYVENGDLLLAKITPSFENGKQAILNFKHPFGFATTEVVPIKGKNDLVLTEYLSFFLKQPDLRNDLAGKMEGSTGRQRLSLSALNDTTVNLPPISEQRKIVYILGSIQKAIEQQDKLIRQTTELKKALMQKLFTEGTKGGKQKQTEIGLVPESWEIVALGVVADVTSGGTPSRDRVEYWENGTIPWVKTGEVDYCVIENAEEHITELGLKNSSAKKYLKGTLLMAMYGQGITRGKVAILGIDATINQACAAIVPKDSSKLIPEYLYYFFEKNYDFVRNLGHGANQKNLSGTLIKGIEISYPKDQKQQQEIISILKLVDGKKSNLEKKKQILSDLFKTLLHELMTAQRRVHEIDLPGIAKEYSLNEESLSIAAEK